MDQHLYTTKGSLPTVLWRPQRGSSVVLKPKHYRPFSQVVRTVHLNDALTICIEHGMTPKPIVSLSSLKGDVLRSYHPCKRLHVLWFGAKEDDSDEDEHDWYGNVEFAISADTMMQRWKNYYLVEMVTAPTHSITRILVTNSDYSSVLPVYDPHTYGGAWYLTTDGQHEKLSDCRRYNGEGYNGNGHTLEFMIEVTPLGMKKILFETEISFRNHVEAASDRAHVCHRSRGPRKCLTPFTRAWTSRWFFKEHHRLRANGPMAKPRLSPSAHEFLKYFLAMEGIPRNNLPILSPQPGLPPSLALCPPPLNDQHFPALPPPPHSFLINHFLQKPMANGNILELHMIGRIAEKMKSKMHPEEEEEREETTIIDTQRHHPKFLPGGPPGHFPRLFGPPPGFFRPPPPFANPFLHLPPPPCFQPPSFQHSWAPLQPIKYCKRN
ncbi:uncharacterized protein LOC123499327 [Portunus trituberculatus]|uniref:uncharacterized protein LOC123499327 n=1 Tax=Portunus trituberculatus TaxID=210409 RepID=UPI001E1D0D15|nr:uncharacterized protein LOC123499327 [Portunus trituberculatus]XP_045103134.1 uncharacterized protein LOC123499327 [Portunus trituberculatus]XP_045103135.1 uncharacterized protein LOC123499327 [Portunus trituberculatus]XP_045103136.1 uncharacterized protein LOC123499327 [Portunus trituberculatus]XP_045103137.1 uncharacterized protein LOC123499327 [Portunus trituberculatus]XP_045103138.1 uncharacterized protein LOC123499327 [Portunus trituberculatus]